jgi:hypothetical protein
MLTLWLLSKRGEIFIWLSLSRTNLLCSPS